MLLSCSTVSIKKADMYRYLVYQKTHYLFSSIIIETDIAILIRQSVHLINYIYMCSKFILILHRIFFKKKTEENI